MFFLKRTKKLCPFALAQRKELKETSTLSKPSPRWEGCKLRFAETDKPSRVLVKRDYALYFFMAAPGKFLTTDWADCTDLIPKRTEKTKNRGHTDSWILSVMMDLTFAMAYRISSMWQIGMWYSGIYTVSTHTLASTIVVNIIVRRYSGE